MQNEVVPFPANLMAEKKVQGRKLDYVEWYHYVMRANSEWEQKFSSQITLLKTEGEYLHIVVRVTDNETQVYHDGVGLAKVDKSKDKGFGGAAPEAYSQAIRRAFALHGMGIDMYMDRDELVHWGIETPQTSAQTPKPAPATLTPDQKEDLGRLGKLLSHEPLDQKMAKLLDGWRNTLRENPSKEQAEIVINAMKNECTARSLPHLMD